MVLVYTQYDMLYDSMRMTRAIKLINLFLSPFTNSFILQVSLGPEFLQRLPEFNSFPCSNFNPVTHEGYKLNHFAMAEGLPCTIKNLPPNTTTLVSDLSARNVPQTCLNCSVTAHFLSHTQIILNCLNIRVNSGSLLIVSTAIVHRVNIGSG